jgi:cysteinyl-tRNA synthetase
MDELAANVLGLDVKKQRHVATGILTGTGAAVVETASVSVKVSAIVVKAPPELTPLVKLIEKLGEKPLGDTEELCLDQLVDIRAQARKQRNFALGDQIRAGLAELGFELLDRPGGVTEWKRK